MSNSRALFSTMNASKYLQQLCKHWSHRFSVEYNATHGAIDFGNGQRLELSANDEGLSLTAAVEGDSELAELETIIADHLTRFAFREQCVLKWQRQ